MTKSRTLSYRRFSQQSFLTLWKEENDFKRKKIAVLTRAKKWTFSKGVSPWILSKNQTFSYRSFSQKLCQNRSFFDILDRKQSFLDQKNEDLTRAKKWTFLKGLVHGFCPKIEPLLFGIFHRNHIRKKSFLTLWAEENDFERKKLKFRKGPKNGNFPKGLVHGF